MQSNPTQTVVSSRTTTIARSQNATLPVTPQLASLEERNQQRSRMAFESSLERLSRLETEGSDGARSNSREIDDERDSRGHDSDEQPREQDQDEKTIDVQLISRVYQGLITATASPKALPTAPMLSAEQIAHLQRMAAAIAEVVKNGVDARMTVEFGMTSSGANAAILGRDRSGALTIHLTGLPTSVASAQLQSMRAELIERLKRRKIVVATVEFLDVERPANLTRRSLEPQDQTPDRT